MSEQIFKINQLVEIASIDREGNKQEVFRSRIEGVDTKTIVLGNPIKEGVIVPLREGDIINVSYIDTTAIYSFDGAIIARQNGKVPTITVNYPLEIKRTQRRNFVRLDVKLDVCFNALNEDLTNINQCFTGETIDLSGGGMMLSTNRQINKGDIIDLQIKLPNNEPVSAVGKIVRASDKSNDGKPIFCLGVDFIVIEEKDRDKIIRYIFNKQRELRQKGLL